ncbi:polysaccharide deacetylase family protein [Marinimicrococcus flavescens]|uniref:Polysaccharide deacetylase family protein n=1 Tax=Marinimicrococcus flavescens TaxID=3031815 RepID=A0AAP3XQA0_9PROT|nr:polysaccharide deacetylase family protein [Marinimicrococcus flavescens]
MSSVPGKRVLIAHLDDVGMCHGVNRAAHDLLGRGFVTCGSVMVPCPWFPEIAETAAARGDLDLGVHLTLTSEWRGYRWRPLTGISRTTGLVDADGYMWRSVPELRARMDPLAVEEELRAQIETARDNGLDPTHLDAHMGAALVPELIETYVRLGEEYQLPILLPRAIEAFLETLRLGGSTPEHYAPWIARLEGLQALFVDRFEVAPAADGPDVAAGLGRLVGGLSRGTTFLALHCSAPGDIELITPERAEARIAAWRACADPALAELAAAEGIQLAGFRELRERYVRSLESDAGGGAGPGP